MYQRKEETEEYTNRVRPVRHATPPPAQKILQCELEYTSAQTVSRNSVAHSLANASDRAGAFGRVDCYSIGALGVAKCRVLPLRNRRQSSLDHVQAFIELRIRHH